MQGPGKLAEIILRAGEPFLREVMFSLLSHRCLRGAMDLKIDEPWEPVFRLLDSTGVVFHVAVCPELDVLVTRSSCRARVGIKIWSLSNIREGVAEVSPYSMELGGDIACLAFFVPPKENGTTTPLLLISNYTADAVHVVDVVTRTRRSMGSKGPSSLIAVGRVDAGHPIVLYRWSTSSKAWSNWRGIGAGQVQWPRSLCFNADGSVLCVADTFGHCLSLFRVSDWHCTERLMTAGHNVTDMVEVEGGWVAASSLRRALLFIKSDRSAPRPLEVDLDGEVRGCALVPSVGIAATHGCSGVTIYAGASVAAMRRMSPARVAWVGTVARGMLH